MKSFKELDNKRKLYLLLLLFLVFCCLLFMIKYQGTFFITGYNRTFPDGCVEQYKNGELISNECTIGRMMVNASQQLRNPNIEWKPEWQVAEDRYYPNDS